MSRVLMVASAVALACIPSVASATDFAGDTTGAPVWMRPIDALNNLSGVGSAVPFSVDAFTVAVSGVYLLVDAPLTTDFDNFLIVYQSSFNPVAPLINAIGANDDSSTFGSPATLALQLTPGITYYAVTTGYNNLDFGKYLLSVTGPGTVSPAPPALVPVPEASSWSMMFAGLGALGYAMRRRRNVKVSFA